MSWRPGYTPIVTDEEIAADLLYGRENGARSIEVQAPEHPNEVHRFSDDFDVILAEDDERDSPEELRRWREENQRQRDDEQIGREDAWWINSPKEDE